MKVFLRVLLIIASLFLLGIGIVLYLVYNSGPESLGVLEERNYDETIDAVEVQLENAQLDIRPSEDDTTHFVLSGNSDNYKMNTEVTSGLLTIEVEDRSPLFHFDFNRSFVVELFVPASGLSSLTANSDNGRIAVNGIQADELWLSTNNGRIVLDAVDSEIIEAETDNGRIEITGTQADINARSSNGRLVFSEVAGELTARTNNGRIELTAETLDFPIDFETDNGRIEIHTETEPANALIEARVDNGSIDIYGHDNEATEFGRGDALIRLLSNNGRITVE